MPSSSTAIAIDAAGVGLPAFEGPGAAELPDGDGAGVLDVVWLRPGVGVGLVLADAGGEGSPSVGAVAPTSWMRGSDPPETPPVDAEGRALGVVARADCTGRAGAVATDGGCAPASGSPGTTVAATAAAAKPPRATAYR